MLATCHENCKGIYLWSNRLVYSPGSNLALRHSGKAIKVDLPLLNPDISDDFSADEMALDHSEEEDLGLLDVWQDGQVLSSTVAANNLVTLSGVPRSTWHGLMFQEEIKERNKPKEVVKKPEQAPFFLGSIDPQQRQLQGKSSVTSASGVSFFEDAAASGSASEGEDDASDASDGGEGSGGSKKRSRVVKGQMGDEGSLIAAIRKGRGTRALRSMAPGRIWTEIQMFEDNDLACVMAFVEKEVQKQTDFELIQAFLNVFLKTHMGSIMQDKALAERVASLTVALGASYENIDGKLQRVSCMLNHFLRLQT